MVRCGSTALCYVILPFLNILFLCTNVPLILTVNTVVECMKLKILTEAIKILRITFFLSCLLLAEI